MPKRSGQKPSEYVGYRHPPTATRFKPGQSGNLKGRPRGTRSVGTILQEVVNRKIPVTDNGKTRKVPALEVALLRLTNGAMKGEPGALKLLFALVDRYGQSAEVTLAIEELLAEDREILTEFTSRSTNTPR